MTTTTNNNRPIKCQKCLGHGTESEAYILGMNGINGVRPARTCRWCNGSGTTNPGGRGYDYHLAKCERENREPEWA